MGQEQTLCRQEIVRGYSRLCEEWSKRTVRTSPRRLNESSGTGPERCCDRRELFKGRKSTKRERNLPLEVFLLRKVTNVSLSLHSDKRPVESSLRM